MNNNFQIVMNHDHFGAWMPLVNSFTKVKDKHFSREKDLWSGVLIQLGVYESIKDDDLSTFTEVTVVTRQGSKVFTRKQFEDDGVWINIVNQGKPGMGKREPMPILKNKTWRNAVQQLYLYDPISSLHHYLKPFKGGITLWSEDGYDVSAEPAPDDVGGQPVATRYTFGLRRAPEFHLEVHYVDENGNDAIFDAFEATHVFIHDDNALPGGTKKNPPQDPP